MPSAQFFDVRLGDALVLGQVEATLSLRSLSSGRPEFAVIRLTQPQLDIVRTDARVLQVAGFTIDLNAPSDDQSGLNWLLAQRRIEIIQGAVSWHDQFGKIAKVQAESLDFVTENRGRSHKLLLKAKLPAAPTDRSLIDLRADFTRPIGASPHEFRRWQGETYAALQALDWQQISPHLAAWIKPEQARALNVVKSGKASAQLWLSVKQKLANGFDGLMNVEVNQAQIVLMSGKKNAEPINIQRLFATASLSSVSGQHQLSNFEWSLQQDKGFQLASSEPGRIAFSDQGVPISGQLGLKPFKVENLLAHIGSMPVTADQIAAFKNRAPKGLIKSTQFDWTLGGEPKSLRWNITAEFDQVAINPGLPHDNRLGVPGFVGLSGKIVASETKGALNLAGGRATLTVPNLFDEDTIPLTGLSSAIRWELSPIAKPTMPFLKVTVDSLNFVNADTEGKITGTYQTGGQGVGMVDLKGELSSGNLLRVYRYMPKHIAPPVRAWVRDAVREGAVEQVSFVVKGDLWDFPYRPKADGSATGVFKVVSKLRGVTLAYSPEWPELKNLTGELTLDGPGLNIAMRSGTVYGVKFSRVEAQIKDFLDSELTVKGSGLGPAQDMVKFVNASPITSRIDNFASATEVTGDAALDLKLVLPLRDLSKTQVDVAIGLTRNQVKVDESLPKFDNVSGQLVFNDSGFSLNNLTGEFLGGPIKVNATPKGPGRLQIKAEGQMSDGALRSLVDNPLTQRLSGLARYDALIDVNGKLSTLEIRSDLVGLTSSLPVPFAKSAASALPMVIKTIPNAIAPNQDRSMGDILNMTIGDDISLAFERRREPKSLRMEIFRGSFGVRADPVIPDSGFAVVANTDRIDLDQWTPILAAMRSSAAGSPTNRDGSSDAPSAPVSSSFAADFSLLPSLVSIAATEVRSGGREVKNVVVGASRVEGFWRANISAQDISGYFTWRDSVPGQGNVGVLTARFNRLKIPKSRAQDVETLLDSAPSDLPGVDISAEELVFDETNFGKLSFVAQNSNRAGVPVWSIKELKLDNPFAKFSATGEWASPSNVSGTNSKQRKTDLAFDLQIADSGGLLNLIGIKDAVKSAPGSIKGNISWFGSPLALDHPSLSGELQIALEKGQFLKVDPGAAKLVGVLNLQSLPKRLVFDFSDMVAQGFTFDKVAGSATIVKGIARTEDLEIRGVQARIKINGTADIARETQDLQIFVTPEINAGLASLAYTAINPAIGLGTLIAQTVLRKPIQEAFSYEVDVTGSWIDPKVEQKKKVPVLRREEENSVQ